VGTLAISSLSLRAIASTIKGSFYMNNYRSYWMAYHWQRGNVYTAWWDSYPFFSWCHAVLSHYSVDVLGETDQLCGLRDHPISLRPTSTCGVIWRESFMPNVLTRGRSSGSHWSGRDDNTQHAWSLSEDKEFLAHDAFTVMVNRFNIFCKQQLATCPVLFTAIKHFIQNDVIYLFFLPRASCCYISLSKRLRPYIYTIYNRFCLPISIKHDAYI
jgi:hypothetical protein